MKSAKTLNPPTTILVYIITRLIVGVALLVHVLPDPHSHSEEFLWA